MFRKGIAQCICYNVNKYLTTFSIHSETDSTSIPITNCQEKHYKSVVTMRLSPVQYVMGACLLLILHILYKQQTTCTLTTDAVYQPMSLNRDENSIQHGTNSDKRRNNLVEFKAAMNKSKDGNSDKRRNNSVEFKAAMKTLKDGNSDKRRFAVHEHPFNPLTIPATRRNDSFDYKAAMKELNDAKVAADDPRLVKLIRDYYIVPPSPKPYNLTNPERLEYSMGQTPYVDSRLNYMEGGFYVECGALDGETGSNTLFFEKVRKWNGLLVEPDPINFVNLMTKNRKAFVINACLNTEPHPAMVTFNKAYTRGRIVGEEANRWIRIKHIRKDEVHVQCFPLYSILLALGQDTVDFFSLDVEGDELKVLQAIPFDKVNIKMMAVEYTHQSEGEEGLKKYVERNGYASMVKVSCWTGDVNDIIFRKKGLKH